MDHGQGQLEKAEVDPKASAAEVNPKAAAATGAERHAFRDDMGDSYGAGYQTRSSDEGYGERYGEAVKNVLEKKAEKEEHLHEIQRGATAERDQKADADVHPDYDRTQGEPVAQKEDSRHSTN
ncbi:hypothetical protein KC19_10G124200 [Ceratodon purpureus]|uniref:Uncharacterized protein n=1 Tax=Ceratodon purpureus TaxID=3225 RepID=A0A8T0GPR2_CERPU|nr:hypothetical protein KC19_10G124200 [Ceratodon purpureus]